MQGWDERRVVGRCPADVSCAESGPSRLSRLGAVELLAEGLWNWAGALGSLGVEVWAVGTGLLWELEAGQREERKRTRAWSPHRFWEATNEEPL